MNKQPVNIKNILYDYLEQSHRGEGAAISSTDLERIFHVKGAVIRRIVNTLRCESKPICSNAQGYFYAATQGEIQETIAQLSSRVHKITKARDGLLKCLDESNERGEQNGKP